MALIPTLCMIALSSQAVTPSSSVPFRQSEDSIIVDATVNGRTIALMFDTGFAAAVMVASDVNIGKVTGTMTLVDFVGTLQASTVKINTLKLGEKAIDTAGMSEAVMSRGDYTSAYGMHCDGLMGFEVIKNNVTGINYEHSRFEFYPKGTDISKWVPDNKRTFLAKLLPTGMSSLELTAETPSGKRMVLALDTGNAGYLVTNRDVLERVNLWPSSATPKFMSQSMVASGAVDSFSLKVNDMKIFGVPVPASIWDVIDLPAATAQSDGTIGFGFLHNFNIVVDYEHRRVWLDNYSGKTADVEVGQPGIGAYGDKKTGGVRVVKITPNSPAEKAGIKEGDTILSIGGEDLPAIVPYQRMRKMLQGPIGSKIQLTISSHGDPKRYELDRAAMFNEVPK